ncbi:MAG: Cof-type HAD-IIB family hydrolase [Pirellulales bacterium]
MSRYRLLALDIDGTLVNLDDEISPATRAALVRAAATGTRIVLATGRRYGRAVHLAHTLTELVGQTCPLVTSSGALVKDPADHRTLHLAELPRPALLKILRTIDAAGFEPIFYADTYHEGYDLYCRTTDVTCPLLAEFMARNAPFAQVWPRLVEDPPAGIFGGFAMGTRAAMLDLARELDRVAPGVLYTHVLRSPKYTGFMCEIAPAGATKWAAIVRIAEHWGIPPAEICAVGDDVNDVPMIEGAGLGIAMGNAPEEVREAADRVAPTLDEDGLAQAIDWMLAAMSAKPSTAMGGWSD